MVRLNRICRIEIPRFRYSVVDDGYPVLYVIYFPLHFWLHRPRSQGNFGVIDEYKW